MGAGVRNLGRRWPFLDPPLLSAHMHLSVPGFPEPVRPGKVVCIGRNYSEHVREMGDVSTMPTEPVVFLKPSTALVASGGAIVIPRQTQDVHHEAEVVAVIGRGGKDIPEAEALGHIAAYGLGLDMTARDLQTRAKDARGPWSVAKGFDTFAPIGPLTPASDVPDPQALRLTLRINGEVRQQGSTAQMMFSFARIVAYVSTVFTLEPGDLIYTGTPEGVGPVHPGDTLEVTADGLAPLTVTVRAA